MVRIRRLMLGCIVMSCSFSVFAQQPPAQQPVAQPPRVDDSTPSIEVPPPPDNATVEELERQGDILRSQKAYLDSIDYYRAAMKKADNAVLHNKAGISYFQLYRDRDAKQEYVEALKLDKNYAEAYNNLGAFYYRVQRYGPAVREYRKAIRISETNASFHSNLGTAYFSQKNYSAATREYARAMELDPTVFEHQTSGGVAIRMITSTDMGHFHYVMAQMYGHREDQQHCRYYLSKANEEGYPIRDALHDGEFASLRKDPDFVAFVRSLKPPPTTE
jgi:tetratricopeptide (TPR) repeat protein